MNLALDCLHCIGLNVALMSLLSSPSSSAPWNTFSNSWRCSNVWILWMLLLHVHPLLHLSTSAPVVCPDLHPLSSDAQGLLQLFDFFLVHWPRWSTVTASFFAASVTQCGSVLSWRTACLSILGTIYSTPRRHVFLLAFSHCLYSHSHHQCSKGVMIFDRFVQVCTRDNENDNEGGLPCGCAHCVVNPWLQFVCLAWWLCF